MNSSICREEDNSHLVGVHKVINIELLERELRGELRVIKRNGTVVPFDASKIAIAMTKAFSAFESNSNNFKTRWGMIDAYGTFGLRSYKDFYTINCIRRAIIEGIKCLLVKMEFTGFIRKIRRSPNLFGCIRNKLMPKVDGKTDSVVYGSNCFFNFLYSICRNHFYGESKNFFGSGREKFEVGYFGVKIG